MKISKYATEIQYKFNQLLTMKLVKRIKVT